MADQELVYCVRCGSPDRLEPIEKQGPTPITPGVNEDQKDWSRYWVKCFTCGGKQLFDSPDPDLVKEPEPPVVENMGLDSVKSIEQLAASGQSLESIQPPEAL